jgi:hypothetical protein|tara:strand:- start:434 stop:679 length:246 start_codon:yes stop_codon:yes gene_type:complete
MELTNKEKTEKDYVNVLKSEMNVLSDRMLDDKTEKYINLHSAIWVLKDRVDEIEGKLNEKEITTDPKTSSGTTSSGNTVSK